VIDRLVDRVDAIALRYRKVLSILGGIWLVISWASNARFISLPEIPLVTGTSGMVASTIFAALWWSWLNPRVQQRRSAREAQATTEISKAEVAH
jgi:hypothetical protein